MTMFIVCNNSTGNYRVEVDVPRGFKLKSRLKRLVTEENKTRMLMMSIEGDYPFGRLHRYGPYTFNHELRIDSEPFKRFEIEKE